MKKGFTLVELLIVVVVISILMAITFRLVGIGDDASKRNETIQKMQKLENCLSGYYAAFGSYPPVPTQGVRQNIYCELDSDGNQTGEVSEDNFTYKSVQVACRAQPVAAFYPYSENDSKMIEELSKTWLKRMNDPKFPAYKGFKEICPAGFNRAVESISEFSTSEDWNVVKVYRFGLMSFLLPRYLFMVTLSDTYLNKCVQWNDQNSYFRDPNAGGLVGNGNSWNNTFNNKRILQRIPSQAVCARWMPNLEGIVAGGGTFFGIKTSDNSGGMIVPDSLSPKLDGYDQKTGTVRNGMTVRDGWGEEFYYYSPRPFQTYRLWSSGSNRQTFAPWVPLNTIKNKSLRDAASNWMADDIMFLSN